MVVGCIDEYPQQAQAFARERKLENRRSGPHALLTGKFNYPR